MALLTAEDVAKTYQISRRTVYNLVSCERIPFLRVGGALRFSVDELDAWIKRHRVAPKGPEADGGAA